MSKTLSAKCYQEDKERLLRKKNRKSNNMVVNITNIYEKMKKKAC